MAVVYKPVHPDRWNPTPTLRKRAIVVHTSESGDTSAQSLINFMSQPGDRQGPSGPYGSSYHAITTNDPTDVPYMQVQGANHGPFSAPPMNATAWHICIPGRASQTRDEWLDRESRYGIFGAAKFIVDMADVDGIPLVKLTPADLVTSKLGYCGHVDVSQAWRQSNHTDPGKNFPWDILAQDIETILQGDDEMSTARLVKNPNYANIWLVGSGPALALSPQLYDSYTAQGVPMVVSDHPQLLESMMVQSGMQLDDLVPV